jgi:hypothetical protein
MFIGAFLRLAWIGRLWKNSGFYQRLLFKKQLNVMTSPQRGFDFDELAVSLKRYPDTKPLFFRSFFCGS